MQPTTSAPMKWPGPPWVPPRSSPSEARSACRPAPDPLGRVNSQLTALVLIGLLPRASQDAMTLLPPDRMTLPSAFTTSCVVSDPTPAIVRKSVGGTGSALAGPAIATTASTAAPRPAPAALPKVFGFINAPFPWGDNRGPVRYQRAPRIVPSPV